MSYKEIILDIMRLGGYKKSQIAEAIGITRQCVWRSLMLDSNMVMENFMRYMDVLGARVVVEWPEPDNPRRKHHWEIE